MNFEGQTVIITGGSRGIGHGIVKAFAQRGAFVHFTYTKENADMLNFLAEAKQNGLNVFAHKVDSTNETLIEKFIEGFDTIDILVNNAGIVSDQLIPLMDLEAWNKVIDVNLNGCFYYLKHVSRKMLEKRKGNIINITSVSALKGVKGQGNYSASKAGIIALTRTLSMELAAKNIRVNAIAPGYIETDMLDTIDPAVKKEYLKSIPLRRFGKVEDVCNLVLFLASDLSGYITGQCIVIDGGLSVQ